MRNGALFEIGAPGPTRTDTVRPLKPLPLPIGVQTLEVEDQAGFEPAESLRCRLKRPARSAATVTGPDSVFDVLVARLRQSYGGSHRPCGHGLPAVAVRAKAGEPRWLRSTWRQLKRLLPL